MTKLTTERHLLFISHALPEDVDVALWVAAKLHNEGYEAWCEVEKLHGGEHFWKEIEPIIRDRTIKFILLASQVSVKKPGVRDEWDFARTVARDFKLIDFIIPINIDGVSPNAIMGLTGLTMVQFQDSWAHGLRALLMKLRKDEVPKSADNTPLSAAHWYFSRHAPFNSIIKKTEKFFSNWVGIPSLPQHLYLHEYINDAQAQTVINKIREAGLFPAVRHDVYLVTFEATMPEIHISRSLDELFETSSVRPLQCHIVDTQLICSGRHDSPTFPKKQDASNLLVQLVQQAVHEFLLSKGLSIYELSSHRVCYFYPRQEEVDRKAKYHYEGKTRTKQLSGTYYESFWHFGVSFNPRLRPELALSFKSHIVFSDDGHTVWNDKKKLFSARRRSREFS